MDEKLDISLFKQEDPYIQKRLIEKILLTKYQNLSKVTSKHIELILSLIKKQKSGSKINLPLNLQVIVNYDYVVFEQEKVVSIVTSIEGSLENAQTTLSSLINILDDLKPCSDSLNKLVTNYNSVSESMVSNILQVKESLKTEIDDAVKVVQTTEGYNDSDASRVQ